MMKRDENAIRMRIDKVANGYCAYFGGEDFGMIGTTFVANDPSDMLHVVHGELRRRAAEIMEGLTEEKPADQFQVYSGRTSLDVEGEA